MVLGSDFNEINEVLMLFKSVWYLGKREVSSRFVIMNFNENQDLKDGS